MKKSELKPLVKQALREMLSKKPLRESVDGTLENYEILFEPLVIPNLTTPTDSVTITISLDYQATSGRAASGLSGPPERSYDAEGAEVSIVDWDFMFITITSEQGDARKIDDFKSVTSEQFKLLKKAVNDYISANTDVIEGQILEKIGDIDDSDGFHPGED